MNILVLAPENDCHAPSIVNEIRKRGHKITQMSGDCFPRRDQLSIRFNKTQADLSVRSHGERIDMFAFDTVWRRRGEFAKLDMKNIHPDDQRFALQESNAALEGLRDIATTGSARWVNPRRAAKQIENKPYQLNVAREGGLTVPETLISNDASDISDFYEEHGGNVIYKALTPVLFKETGRELVSFVNKLPRDVVDDGDLLKLSPGIYQPFIDKVFELRVNVFGDQILTTRINNQHVEGAEIDWRSKVHLTQLSPFQLPEWLADKILKFMRTAGLVFGALDFIVTTEGEFVFLEVNQMGQFLWLDDMMDTSIHMHAMCDMLCYTT